MRRLCTATLLRVAVAVAPPTAHAAQPDLESTRQMVEWTELPQHNGSWAWAVSAAGDLNADGYDDLVVGSPTQAFPGPNGRVYVYYGSSAGIDEASEQVAVGPCKGFAGVVSGLGDVGDDGYDDIVIGSDCGFAWVVHGGPAGLDPTTAQRLTASDPVDAGAFDSFGGAVGGAGDVNGDGVCDVVIGRAGADAVYLYYGSAGGVDPASEQRVAAPPEAAGAYYGVQVLGAGDIDGDGYDDVAVGLFDGGAVYLYYGGAAGLQEGSMQALLPPPGAESLFANNRPSRVGLSAAGDLDADGYDDLAVIAPAFPRAPPAKGTTPTTPVPPAHGAVLVYYGGPAGLDPTPGRVVEPTDVWDLQRSIAAAGDVDADGHDDLLVGVSRAGDSQLKGAYVHYGGPRDLLQLRSERLEDPDGYDHNAYGDRPDGGVDFNGDGADDLIVGDPEYGVGQTFPDAGPGVQNYWPAGAVFLYYGAAPANPTETGDTGDTSEEPSSDTATPTDTAAGDGARDTRGRPSSCGGCSVASATGTVAPFLVVALLVPGLRRRRQQLGA